MTFLQPSEEVFPPLREHFQQFLTCQSRSLGITLIGDGPLLSEEPSSYCQHVFLRNAKQHFSIAAFSRLCYSSFSAQFLPLNISPPFPSSPPLGLSCQFTQSIDASLFFHPPSILTSLPPTSLSNLFSLICCVFHLGHPQPVPCFTLLLAC